MNTSNKNNLFSFGGRKYFLDLAKLKDVCITPSNKDGNNELEISQAYEVDDSGELKLSSKIEHETKTFGTPQNDMIVYDFVKLLIVSLLEYDGTEDLEDDMGIVVTVNTLLYWGILKEVI